MTAAAEEARTGGPVIDLNADLGEGAGHDEALLEVVTSANVACGAHAGDAMTILATCRAAVERGVVIGAHPGYPDRENFGRLAVAIEAHELRVTIDAQLRALTAGAAAVGGAVRYVKAHGALYHAVAADHDTAAALRDAIASTAAPSVVLGPPGASTTAVVEGFADRAYTLDGAGRPTLVDRRHPGALLDHDAAVAQAVSLATTGFAGSIPVHPRSICVHGDSPGAVALAREIRSELERAGVRVEPFA